MPLGAPVILAPGVVVTFLSSADFMDLKNGDGFGLGPCNATAISGQFFMAMGTAAGLVRISFDDPVASFHVHMSGADGTTVTLELFNAAGTRITSNAHAASCPALTASDRRGSTISSNVIAYVEISGDFVVFDDIEFTRLP